MGNGCHKSSKKSKNPQTPDQLKGLAQPPALKNSPNDKKRDESNREYISLAKEKDPAKINDKLRSTHLTELLQSDSFDLENYLVRLKELDIDIMISIGKQMETNFVVPSDKSKEVESGFQSLKDNFGEYQSKYLGLQPKESKELCMLFLFTFVEGYHLVKIHDSEKNDKTFFQKWNPKSGNFKTDWEYMHNRLGALDGEMRKYFGGNPRIIIEDRKPEKYYNITQAFILEIFDFSLKKAREESFVESWCVDPLSTFGLESDHKGTKCFDYKFEIHMMSH